MGFFTSTPSKSASHALIESDNMAGMSLQGYYIAQL